MKFGNIDAFALDFDGTLADTIKTHNEAREQAFVQMAKQTGDERFATVDPAIHAEAHAHGSHPQTIIGWVLMQSGIADSIDYPLVSETVTIKKEIYKELSQNGQDEIPGAASLVRCLARSIPGRLAIVTTAHRETEVLPYLRRYDLDQYFNAEQIIAAEDVTHTKPHPEAYEIFLARVGMQNAPDRAAALEDTWRGIMSANTAGIGTTIAVATTSTREQLSEPQGDERPDFIVDSLKQLEDMWTAQR